MEAVRKRTGIRGRVIAMTAAKYIFLFGAQISLSLAEIYGIRPFGAGFFIAVTFLGIKSFITVPFYLAAEAVASADLYTFLAALTCGAVVFAAKTVKPKATKAWKYIAPVFTVVSQSGLVFLSFSHGYTVLMIVVSSCLTLAFMYAVQAGLRPVIVEKLKYKMLETELVCLAAVLIAAALGLSRANIYSFPLIALIASFCIFSAGRLAGAGASVIVALCFGLGDALNTYNVEALAVFVFVAAVSGVFLSAPRLLTALSGIVAYVMFTFYFFSEYSAAPYWICALGLGGALFAVLPQSLFTLAKESFFESHERAAVRFMINQSRADTGNAILSTARIFEGMSGMLGRKSDNTQVAAGSLEVKCCEFCENKDDCKAAGVLGSLQDMMKTVRESGHVAVSDIPDAVSRKCVHLGRLVAAANEIEDKRKKLVVRRECEEGAKKMMASYFSGVATAMKNTALQAGGAVPFDNGREKIVVEELNYCGISCAQCLIAGESVALILRSECLDRKLIEKTVGRLMRGKFRISGIDDTVMSGFCAVRLERAPKYDVVFGVAGVPKTAGEKSGDTHSFIKLGRNRLMIALCDGMGSGESAENLSETAIGLIENFFRAGFDASLVLKSVNSFLGAEQKDGFSAMDIAVIDLDTLKADIIKLSTPATYIKRKGEVGKIEGKSLPLGAVEQISPFTATVDLSVGDMLVMETDGVSDSFAGDKLSAAVNNLRTVNPRIMAEGILEHTLANCGGSVRDDSTVICAKIVELQ